MLEAYWTGVLLRNVEDLVHDRRAIPAAIGRDLTDFDRGVESVLAELEDTLGLLEQEVNQ